MSACAHLTSSCTMFSNRFFYSSFFLLFPHHPRSTLFPYTTLFRTCPGACRSIERRGLDRASAAHHREDATRDVRARSEEHTSELQSLTNLVCRLLLEKKKKHDKNLLGPPRFNPFRELCLTN